MVNSVQLERGIAEYLDEEFMPKIPKNGMQRIIIGTGASILIRRLMNIIDCLKQNELLSTMQIIDEEGNIDIDVIMEELRHQIPDDGYKISMNNFGNLDITLSKKDVAELYKKITRKEMSDDDRAIARI